MNIRARTALSAAGIMLVATGAAGCGGGDSDSASDSPSSVSKSDFCAAFATFDKNVTKVATSTDAAKVIKTIKAEAKKLGAVGTPSNITDSERKGLQVVLDAIDKLPDDATAEDLSKVEDGLSAADKKNSDAFTKYLAKECPDLDTGS